MKFVTITLTRVLQQGLLLLLLLLLLLAAAAAVRIDSCFHHFHRFYRNSKF